MSRRPPNPAAERAAQNQQTIKSLLKLEPNKICADCKRNKHPRWASWNLGVFICIRCSGIHRGMGTHISRVKSVDLDSWTDEQMQSILSWGNARANKYWESKLGAGHMPSEAKIENFIRTKYELKRWVMPGPIPDPSTLDTEGDDEIPLSLVKEKQTIDKKEIARKESIGQSSRGAIAPPLDLIGGDDPVPQRASTAGPPPKVPPKSGPAPPKATAAKDSLLGLDFFGDTTTSPPRPASSSATGAPGGQSRPDLKQSILSLYASAPKQQAPPQPAMSSGGNFGGMASPTFTQQPSQPVGGLNDAFGSLSFGNTTAPKPQPADPFGSLISPKAPAVAPASSSDVFGGLSGGGFFDPKPAQPAAPTHPKQLSGGGFGGFGGMGSLTSSAVPQPPKPAPASSAMGDLFDLSTPPTSQAPAPVQPPTPSTTTNSVFNLSSNQPKPPPAMTTVPINPLPSTGSSGWGGADVWGGNAWAAPEAAPTAAPASKSPPASKPSTNDFGWGGPALSPTSLATQSIVPGQGGGFAPKVAADEEFGGWAGGSAKPAAPTTQSTGKPAGGFGGGGDDLFSNVWQ